jgi:hypothetical protein
MRFSGRAGRRPRQAQGHWAGSVRASAHVLICLGAGILGEKTKSRSITWFSGETNSSPERERFSERECLREFHALADGPALMMVIHARMAPDHHGDRGGLVGSGARCRPLWF